MKLEAGSLSFLTSDKPISWIYKSNGEPVMVADVGSFRPMTEAETAAYCAQLRIEQEADGYDD